jgi:hypothetical protein
VYFHEDRTEVEVNEAGVSVVVAKLESMLDD